VNKARDQNTGVLAVAEVQDTMPRSWASKRREPDAGRPEA
jgi:hypothetical protein